MLGAGGETAAAVANASASAVSLREQVRSSKEDLDPWQELLAKLKVYPFPTCVEPRCEFQVPAE